MAARHLAQHRLEELIGADELQRGHLLQRLPGGVEERLQQTPAGRIDRDVDTAHLFDRRIGQLGKAAFLRDVARPPCSAGFLCEVFQHIGLATRDHNLRPFINEPARHDLAHIFRAARAQNDRPLAFQPFHIRSPALVIGSSVSEPRKRRACYKTQWCAPARSNTVGWR